MYNTKTNCGNNKTSDILKLLLNFSDKIDLKRRRKMLLYQILASIIHRKYKKVMAT